MEFLDAFTDSDFMPHGHCYLWRPGILWLHVSSDVLIAAAYFSIPLALISFVRRRPEFTYAWMLWMFGTFLLLCGATHALQVFTTWVPSYLFEGLVKAATAGVSLATALALWPVVPRAAALPSPAELAAANEELRREIERREGVERELREAQADLERRVEERTRALQAKTAELELSNRELEEFAHVVSHDLKTPLRGMGALVAWIREDAGERLGEGPREHLDLIEQRAERMQALIDGILRYARAGRRAGGTERVDAQAVAQEAVDALPFQEGVSVRVEGELPPVRFGRTPLLQVFQNLLGNAVRHLGRPDGTVTVSAREAGGEVEFAVRDDGVGISERHRERIFKIFRAQPVSAANGSSGVGLAIVKKLVELHGGRVWVEDTPGGGATFRFTAPRAGREGRGAGE